MRVYVVGGPGSGKSSLADVLARRARLTALHLDDHWDRAFESDGAGAPTPSARAFRERLIREQLAQDAWVIEGAEPPFLRALADASDLIVWCDVPFRVAAYRMVRRHVLADLQRRNSFPGHRRLWRFLRSVRRRYVAPLDASQDQWVRWTRARVARDLERYQAKTIRSRGGGGEREARKVFDALERSRVHSRARI